MNNNILNNMVSENCELLWCLNGKETSTDLDYVNDSGCPIDTDIEEEYELIQAYHNGTLLDQENHMLVWKVGDDVITTDFDYVNHSGSPMNGETDETYVLIGIIHTDFLQ